MGGWTVLMIWSKLHSRRKVRSQHVESCLRVYVIVSWNRASYSQLMVAAMAEVVARLLLAFAFTVLLIPLLTPYVLLRSIFDAGAYWRNVRRRYWEILKRWMEWGCPF